jgi:PAS domain S-box-containing protein
MTRALDSPCNSTDAVAALLDYLDEAVVICDLAGTIVGWSHGAEQLLGQSATQALGTACATLYPEDELAAHQDRWRQRLLGAAPVEAVCTVLARGGQRQRVRVRLSLLRGTAGAPAGMIINFTVHADGPTSFPGGYSRLSDWQQLVDSAPIMLMELDQNRRFVFLNATARSELRAYGASCIGRHVRDVFGDDNYQQLRSRIDQVLAGQEVFGEVTIRDPGGGVRHAIDHLVPKRGPDGSVEGYFLAALDITETRIAQEQMLAQERDLRRALIREVHHRVKNGLQGVVGLMRLQEASRPQLAEFINLAVGQLKAIAAGFGLASRHGDSRILLCDLVAEVAREVGEMSHHEIDVELSPATLRQPVALSEDQSTNLSVIINELLVNAVKHGALGRNEVKVRVDRNKAMASLTVSNSAGRLPADFNLQTGAGLGTGLSLIRLLVPPGACDLSISEQQEGVFARLQLRSPVLAFDQAGSVAPAS